MLAVAVAQTRRAGWRRFTVRYVVIPNRRTEAISNGNTVAPVAGPDVPNWCRKTAGSMALQVGTITVWLSRAPPANADVVATAPTSTTRRLPRDIRQPPAEHLRAAGARAARPGSRERTRPCPGASSWQPPAPIRAGANRYHFYL